MLSVPHSTTAIVSGHLLPFSAFCTSSSLHGGTTLLFGKATYCTSEVKVRISMPCLHAV